MSDSKLRTDSKPRKLSIYDEDIVVKPSTELIPDEYENISTDQVLLHFFCASEEDEGIPEDLLNTFQSLNYKVNKNNVHNLTKKEVLDNDFKTIKEQAVDKTALMLIFIGYYKQDGTILMNCETPYDYPIKTIWNYFSGRNCLELANKPKLFVFCISPIPQGVQFDSIKHHTMRFDKVYDVPSEADILIVYKKINDISIKFKKDFITQLCWNIKMYSKQYDIIDIFTCMQRENPKTMPLIISTFTRKFYLTPNSEREHYFSIVENHINIDKTLEKIKDHVEKLHVRQKKKKEKNNFFSFRRKTDEKPKVNKRENPTTTVKAQSAKPGHHNTAVGSSRVRNASETDVGISNVKRPSTSSITGRPPWKI